MQIMVDIEGIDWNTIPLAPVAQLDRALPSEGRGHRFESCRVRHFFNDLGGDIFFLSTVGNQLATTGSVFKGSNSRFLS